ncbi:hypothetical protein EYC84_011330 [Monilinia fructicola]|uniref:Uncharacterized protein n=1 Tax=Monilinia fructicola TaxID=38448 RepID=A0A5M9J9Q3_MONFR|nr:hypothetical protein EYC84_011330 [Monilinia fructicola]
MDHISTGPTDLFKTNQIHATQAVQHPTTVVEEGSEYALSSIESENETSDSHHSQSVIASKFANGAKVVEVNSTSSRIMSQIQIKIPRSSRPEGSGAAETASLLMRRVLYTGPSSPPKRVVSNNGRKSATRTDPAHGVERPRSILTRRSLGQQVQPEDAVVDQDADPALDQYGVPPVPKIPQHVRLPSGEMLNTMIPRLQQTQPDKPSQTTKEPGDWPEDLEIF